MNKVFMGIMLIVVSANSYAIDCKYLSEIAGEVMHVRQAGYPAAQLIEDAGDSDIAKALILEAYKQPRYKSESYRENAAKDFAKDVYIECLEVKK